MTFQQDGTKQKDMHQGWYSHQDDILKNNIQKSSIHQNDIQQNNIQNDDNQQIIIYQNDI